MDVDNITYKPGLALDVGTSFIQAARQTETGEVEFTSERDAFFEIIPKTLFNSKAIEKSLQQRDYFYLNKDGNFYLVGTQAINYANEVQQNVLRPLKRGVLSSKDKDSFGMLSVILEQIVGPPLVKNERCLYSYPADPIDSDFDTVYHRDLIGKILTTLGYNAIPILEAEALMYSELLDYDLTGVTMSWGAGMTNVCVAHLGSNLVSFSITKGGDWIDEKVGGRLEISETIIQAEKEEGLDLKKPKDDIQEGVAIYYKSLMEYVAANLELKFKSLKEVPRFREPVVIVISGGSSLVDGFIDTFSDIIKWKDRQKTIKRNFPFTIKEIVPVKDPLRAVASGLLIAAQSI